MGIHESFLDFHAKNPRVYELFVRFARILLANGHSRAGAKLIFERMRWELMLETTDRDFKLNNNYTAYYARMAMQIEPDLAGFFGVRKRRDVKTIIPGQLALFEVLQCH